MLSRPKVKSPLDYRIFNLPPSNMDDLLLLIATKGIQTIHIMKASTSTVFLINVSTVLVAGLFTVYFYYSHTYRHNVVSIVNATICCG